MIEQLLLEIQDRLKKQVPELQTVDEDYGQMAKMFSDAQEDDIYPVISPAVFLNLEGVQWTNLAGPSQQGVAQVSVTLVVDCYDDTHTGQDDQRKRIEDRLALNASVHWALQGFKPSETTKLIRRNTRFYHLPHLWKAYETTYSCVVTDLQPEDETRQSTLQGFSVNPQIDTDGTLS